MRLPYIHYIIIHKLKYYNFNKFNISFLTDSLDLFLFPDFYKLILYISISAHIFSMNMMYHSFHSHFSVSGAFSCLHATAINILAVVNEFLINHILLSEIPLDIMFKRATLGYFHFSICIISITIT